MNGQIKVLLVEDTVEDAELLIRDMRQGGLDVDPYRIDTRKDFELALEQFCPDLILSDYSLPGFGGTSALEIASQNCPLTPFIFVSGTIGEERAIEALRLGAIDYVLKDNRARLVPCIRRALQEAEERQGRRCAGQELKESETRFRLFMNYLPGAAYIKDLNRRFTYVNKAVEQMIGRNAGELIGHTIDEFYSPQLSELYKENDERAILTRGDVV